MKQSDKLKISLSKSRERLSELAAKDDATEEERAEMKGLTEDYKGLEERYQAAVTAEADEDRQAAAAGDLTADSEAKERFEIRRKATIGRYLDRAANQRALDGPESELNAALGVHGDRMPLSMVLKPVEDRGGNVEDRADSATELSVDTITRPEMWLSRVFVQSAAGFLGVTRRSVPDGQTSLPVVSSGATAETVGKGAVKDAEVFGLSVTELKPQRLSARYQFSLEDAARLGRGTYEDALRSDLQMTLSSQSDDEIINGKPADNSLIKGLLDETPLLLDGKTDAALSAATSGKEFVDGILSAVDGRYAAEPSDLKFIAEPKLYATLPTLALVYSGTEAVPVSSVLADSKVMAKAAGHIGEISGQAGESYVVISRAIGLPGAAVHAVWDALQVIRDPYSDAANGRVNITVCMLHDFKVVRPANYLVRRVART